ncbi:MAG: hypothetical protein OXT65_03440 [Alphaproteobacteria bacterium]|nr:hypothetical protein [Alphaproteobacteria bacterium]
MTKKKRLFSAYKYDIAFSEGVSPHLVTWVSGLMVFFIALALAVSFALTSVTKNWTQSLTGSLTVELAPGAPAVAEKISALEGQHPDVSSARVLAATEVQGLLAPWLGDAAVGGFSLPVLVDVQLIDGASVARVKRDIAAIAPMAVIDDHAEALSSVTTVAQVVRGFVSTLSGAVLLLAIVSIAGIVRAKFAIHRQEVETLHLIGASDEYIARQFRHHTLRGVLLGAVLGVAAMAGVFIAAGMVTHTLNSTIWPQIQMLPLQWIVLLVSPLAAGCFIAHVTAQRAVTRELESLA